MDGPEQNSRDDRRKRSGKVSYQVAGEERIEQELLDEPPERVNQHRQPEVSWQSDGLPEAVNARSPREQQSCASEQDDPARHRRAAQPAAAKAPLLDQARLPPRANDDISDPEQ